MPEQINVNIKNATIDGKRCTAGQLLEIFDQQGEAAMLNALHSNSPSYHDKGEIVFEDGSVVTYIARMRCYSFGSEQRNPLHEHNPIRTSHLGVPPTKSVQDLPSESRVLNVTNHMVFTQALRVTAEQHHIDLPEDLHLHHGLVIHMAANATDALEDTLKWYDSGPSSSHMQERLVDIQDMLARRMLLELPEYQQQQMLAAVKSLAANQ